MHAERRRRGFALGDLQRRDRVAVCVQSLFGLGIISREPALHDVLDSTSVRIDLAACGRKVRLRYARRSWKKELGERLVEDRHIAERSTQNGPKGVAHRAFVGQIDDLERARRVVDLTGADAERVDMTQESAERDQIVGKRAERVHQRRGVETEPTPKSVLSAYPPDSEAIGAPARIGSSSA